MRMNMLAIEAMPDKKLMVGKIFFRWRVHHVKEVFMHFLPKDFELDGSSKVQLSVGDRGDEDRYETLLGSTNFWVEDFDFDGLASDTQAAGDRRILAMIEASLIEIARAHAAQPEQAIATLKAAAKATADSGFEVCIAVPKLTKSSSDRRFKLTVNRLLAPTDGETWVASIADKEADGATPILLSKRPNYLDLTDYFHKTVWNTDHFELSNRAGKVVASLEP